MPKPAYTIVCELVHMLTFDVQLKLFKYTVKEYP